jgi:hypothetical protein
MTKLLVILLILYKGAYKMKQINKPNEVNNIISMNKDNDVVIARKGDSKNIIGSFYFNQWSDSKEMKMFIKNIERQIRMSNEYKTYIGHLNNEIGIHNCAIFGNLSDSIDGVTFEFHHYPFTLYDIVEICINKRLMNNENFTSLDIAYEVLKLHELNQVGLVKLSKTAHELVHAGKIFIKLESIFGDVNAFVNKYEGYISEDIKENYNKLIDMNNNEFDESIIKA